MSNREELVKVLKAIIELLVNHGQATPAEWLEARVSTLEDPGAQPEAIKAISEKLHRIVPGMGGLHDLPLKPSPETDSFSAREELDQLAARLYELTG